MRHRSGKSRVPALIAVDLVAFVSWRPPLSCAAGGYCGGVRPYLAAGKAAFLVAYTNLPRQMDAYCAVA